MSEENLSAQFAKPWVSLGSDAEALAPEGVFLKSNPHPRAYGNHARFLAKYVREQKLMPLEEGIRRLTGLPAANLKLKDRGLLRTGFHADLAVFDPAKVQDHATFDRPHQYASGVVHVVVNGRPVLVDGEHTGERPGRVVRGPGWRP
jgi:N-acyl-D-amino-acid deacylase